MQVDEQEEEDEDPEVGGAEASGEGEEEENNDQTSDSNNDKSESLGIDHPDLRSGVHKNPEDEIMPQDEVGEEEYNPGQQSQEADEGNLLYFDLADLFGAEYLWLLDLNEPHLASHKEPSVAIWSGKESGNPPVPTTAVEQQTLPQSLFTSLPIKRKILYVSERVNLKKELKK